MSDGTCFTFATRKFPVGGSGNVASAGAKLLLIMLAFATQGNLSATDQERASMRVWQCVQPIFH